MAGNDAVALRGESRLTLAVSEHYTIANDPDTGWQVQRVAYFYAIGLHDTGELLAYHWHPLGKSSVLGPHLHVRANIQLGERWLGKVHLPFRRDRAGGRRGAGDRGAGSGAAARGLGAATARDSQRLTKPRTPRHKKSPVS